MPTLLVVTLLCLSAVRGLASTPTARDGILAASEPVPIPPGSNFATYLGSIQRTGSVTQEEILNQSNASSVHLLWETAVGSPITSEAVTQNDSVFFGAQNGNEYALNTLSGKTEWHAPLGQDSSDPACGGGALGVSSTATTSGSKIYVSGPGYGLVALNASGDLLWNATLGGTPAEGFYDWSSPLLYNGEVYVGIASECGRPAVLSGLAAFSTKTHAEVGSFDTSAPDQNGSSVMGSPALNPATNALFLTTGNRYGNNTSVYSDAVIELNATTLALVHGWQIPSPAAIADGGFGGTPTLIASNGANAMVVAADQNGTIYALYQSNFSLAWSQAICCSTNNADDMSAAWGGGQLYVIIPGSFVNGTVENSSIRDLYPSNGTTRWSVDLRGTTPGARAAPLWVNGVVVVPDGSSLLFLNGQNGSLDHQFNATGDFDVPPSVARGEVYAGSSDGTLYAFDVALNATASDSEPTGPTPLDEMFDVTATGGLPPYTYVWQFGDGGTAAVSDPAHVFERAGNYSVFVNVTDAAGNVTVSRETVSVTAGPPATAPAKGTGPFSKLIKYALVGAAALVIAVVALYWWVHRRPPAGSDRPSTATAGPTTTATPEPDPSAEAPAPLAG